MKNKGVLHILIITIALALFSCAGESSDANNDVASTEAFKESDDITSEVFEELEQPNTELTKEQIEAFELRAIQKFEDFTDYLEIISDPNIEDDLLHHSNMLVEELFINDSITNNSMGLIWSYALFNKNKTDSLRSTKQNWPEIAIKTKSIEFINHLTQDSLSEYKGIMKTSYILNGKRMNTKIDVHIVNIDKLFGDKKQTVKEVRLGNIY